jgi:spore germination cell wall hydrolase CwlJ-like protein
MISPQDMTLLALCLWREARGESITTKQAVAWAIRNRVLNPGWWGRSWWSVILMHSQFSSFNHNDPNAVLWPTENDSAWTDCLSVAADIGGDSPSVLDPTGGATSYFDKSLDNNPPSWATDGSQVHKYDSGRLHFYGMPDPNL